MAKPSGAKPRNRTFPYSHGGYWDNYRQDQFYYYEEDGTHFLEIRRQADGTRGEIRRQAISLRDWLNQAIEYLGE